MRLCRTFFGSPFGRAVTGLCPVTERVVDHRPHFCHCEERSDVAIRFPVSACIDARLGMRIATSGVALLAMTMLEVRWSSYNGRTHRCAPT